MDDLPLALLRDESTPAIVLLTLVLNKYSMECLEWDASSLCLDIADDYGVTLSSFQADRLMAASTILTTDMAEQDWVCFEVVCNLLAGIHASPGDFQPLDAETLVMALAELELIKIGDEDGIKYSDEVAAYAGCVFYEYGFVTPPDIAPWAIMPALTHSDPVDESGKNEALRELYDTRRTCLQEAMRKVKAALGN